MSMQLFIGNKNYSSWSMRPWVLLRQAEIPFEEVMLRFDSFTPDSRFKTELALHSPAGRVPVLVDEGFAVWDTLAIAEYVAEKYPDRQLWPADRQARARARSVCAEMHAGFGALRSHFPMNIEAVVPEVGQRILREHPPCKATSIGWCTCGASCWLHMAGRCCSARSRSRMPSSHRWSSVW
jgi:glutathione S-transferase